MTLKYVVYEVCTVHTEKPAFHFNNILFVIPFHPLLLCILPKHYLRFNAAVNRRNSAKIVLFISLTLIKIPKDRTHVQRNSNRKNC